MPRRIRGRRKDLGVTQEQLALDAGVATSAVIAWEKGERLPEGAETWARLSLALEASVDYLLTGREPIGFELLIGDAQRLLTHAHALRYGHVPGKISPNAATGANADDAGQRAS